ncbi:DNA methyltransferase [Staphylococcus epidermidis]
MSTNILDEVSKTLNGLEKYWLNEKLLKQAIIEDLRNNDAKLISKLLANKSINEIYVQNIDNYKIFDKEAFISMLRYKNYWQDSYTKYTNKIGLTASGKYLNYNSDVVLDFPFKDCILEGGMTKEDSILKNNEKFYNNVIAKDEIDTLIAPKSFTNIKKYDESGEHKINEINDNDNLIIKGNNLIALHSLKKKYAGKVKVIYIDPPYNTGNDGFQYNDKFNRASWLTFMKNRLEVAKELLADDGLLFVELDYNEVFHFKVMCDDIFNFINVISVQSSTPSGVKTSHASKTILKSQDFILVYSKTDKYIFNPQYKKKANWDTHYSFYIDKKNNKLCNLVDVLRKKGILQDNQGIKDFDIKNNKHKAFYLEHGDSIVRKSTHDNKEIKKVANSEKYKNKLYHHKNGFFYLNNDMLQPISRSFKTVLDGTKITTDVSNVLCDFWDDIDFQNTQNQGNVSFPKGKKPEQLLYRIINMTTKENDIVLDFFMGAATTQAVAHKMNRQYIGIEQMDYINTVSVPRIQNVINGEKGGISKGLEWNGGGSFVYAELAKENQEIVDQIISKCTKEELSQQINKLFNEGILNYEVDFDKFINTKKEFSELKLEDQKEVLIRILDNNQLYVNYSDIEDSLYDFSEEEITFNHSFYGGE